MLRLHRALVISVLLALPGAAAAAETVHLTLNGTNQGQIEGDSTQTSLGRENTVECVLFRYSLRSTGTGTQAGTVTCRKRLDRATAKLINALVMREEITMSAAFFRPNPSGDGTTEQHYTVVGTMGRVVAVKQLTPDTSNPSTSSLPHLEEVVFEFRAMSFIWSNGGIQADWEAPRN